MGVDFGKTPDICTVVGTNLSYSKAILVSKRASLEVAGLNVFTINVTLRRNPIFQIIANYPARLRGWLAYYP